MSEVPAKTILRAEWYFDGLRLAERDCAVVFAGGTILQVGRPKHIREANPDARFIDLGNAILIHGLTNAHTHLELSGTSCGEPPASFVDWILSMPRRVGRELNAPADDKFAAGTRIGIEQSLKFGVTCVGDISQQMHVTRPVLKDSPLRAISYGEVIGLGKRRGRFEELFPIATDTALQSDRLTIGVSPHSPYTVEPRDIRRCVDSGLPMTIHLAETPDEEEFLRHHRGPMREMWEKLGTWEGFPERFDGTPVEFAQAMGLLKPTTRLAHVNYCSDADLDILSRSRATVVYCPRTHRYFGHPPHRWREMIARGINVAVGTDSCASSPDLNMVDELRLLHEIAPEHPVEEIWATATRNAWMEGQGLFADFSVFDVSTDEPLKEILENASALPREVWIDGAAIVSS